MKTVWHHSWAVHILHKDHEEVRTELSNKTVDERIGGDLVTAERQLRAENPDHALPNAVLLVNRDPDASLAALSRVLTGHSRKTKRSLKARHDEMLAGEIKRFCETVDLCLWASPAEDREIAVEGYFLFNPELRTQVEGLQGLGRSKLISLKPAA
ncbi:MAG: hypothetical protein ACRD27_09965 [Terracidiphilus sp.]